MQPDYKPSKPASLQFWGGMIALVVFWIAMIVLEISKPTYLILAIMALFFVLMNLFGYYRCRNWSTQVLRMQQAGGGFGNVVSGFTSGMAQNFMVRALVTIRAVYAWPQKCFPLSFNASLSPLPLHLP
jgi:hypothetical protein